MIGRRPNFHSRVRLDGPTRQAIETGRTRLLVTGATFAIAFAVVGFRLVDVTLLKFGNEPRIAQSHRGTALKTGRADVTDRTAENDGGHRSVECVLRHFHQMLHFLVDLADREGPGRIGAPAVQLDSDIDRNDVPVVQDSLGVRNAVDDLLIQRSTDAPGETVQAFERGHGPSMGSDEIVREPVDLERRDPGSNPWTDLHQKIGDDRTAPCNRVDLFGSLEVDHIYAAASPRAPRTSI